MSARLHSPSYSPIPASSSPTAGTPSHSSRNGWSISGTRRSGCAPWWRTSSSWPRATPERRLLRSPRLWMFQSSPGARCFPLSRWPSSRAWRWRARSIRIALHTHLGFPLGAVVHTIEIVGVPASQNAVEVQPLYLLRGIVGTLVEEKLYLLFGGPEGVVHQVELLGTDVEVVEPVDDRSPGAWQRCC